MVWKQFEGVESAGLKGDEKKQIEIIGEGVDAAELTNLLRKNVGHAELVSVGPVEDKKDEETPKQDQGIWNYCEGARVPHYPICEYRIVNQHEDPYCSIMWKVGRPTNL